MYIMLTMLTKITMVKLKEQEDDTPQYLFSSEAALLVLGGAAQFIAPAKLRLEVQLLSFS